MSRLEAQLDSELRETFNTAARHDFRPVRFLQMLVELRGVQTVARLLGSGETDVAAGLARLYELKLLHVSVEAVMLKPEYKRLFSDEQRQVARARLQSLNYRPTWDV